MNQNPRRKPYRFCFRWTVEDGIGVKAAGGIRTLAEALAMIEAGASRIGAIASVAIVGQLEE